MIDGSFQAYPLVETFCNAKAELRSIVRPMTIIVMSMACIASAYTSPARQLKKEIADVAKCFCLAYQ